MKPATVTRYRDGYYVEQFGLRVGLFEYGIDGTAAECAAGAHLLARARSSPGVWQAWRAPS